MYIKLATATEQERLIKILKGWQFDRKQHGCLFDRGSADSYYGRARHRGRLWLLRGAWRWWHG